MSRDLLAWIAERRVLCGDGAMGTALLASGLPPGACPERWNLDRPESVEAILRAYLDAGAELLETNSFGGSPERLAAHDLEDRCETINRAAAAIARRVAGDDALVLGSIGPTGALLEPLGPLPEPAAEEGFRRQAAALAEGGADALVVETMMDAREACAAVRGAAATGLPVIACLTYEETPRGFYTVMGADPVRAARECREAGAAMVGANCGTGPAVMIEMIRALRSATSLPILAQPNAGIPVISGADVIYPAGPEEMGAAAPRLVEAGASIVGGCCGTTAAHVKAMAAALRRIR